MTTHGTDKATAWADGLLTGLAGGPPGMCPYGIGTDPCIQWLQGYAEGLRDGLPPWLKLTRPTTE